MIVNTALRFGMFIRPSYWANMSRLTVSFQIASLAVANSLRSSEALVSDSVVTTCRHIHVFRKPPAPIVLNCIEDDSRTQQAVCKGHDSGVSWWCGRTMCHLVLVRVGRSDRIACMNKRKPCRQLILDPRALFLSQG